MASTSLCPSWDMAEGQAPSTELWTCHLTALSLPVIYKAGAGCRSPGGVQPRLVEEISLRLR